MNKLISARRAAAVTTASAAAIIARSYFAEIGDCSEKDGDGNDGAKVSKEKAIGHPSRMFPNHAGTAFDFVSLLRRPGISACRCESESAQNFRKDSFLRRRHTIKRLDETSTRTSLQSKYKVDWSKPIGEGAFGVVYTCTDRSTGERMACKKIDKRYTKNEDFQRELNALMHIRSVGWHPNICSLHENYEEGGFYYLILDLISGGEMFDHLIKNGAYSEADAARLVQEVASALAFLHGTRVVHGDLKPENLMLSSSNATDAVIKVVDFGCSEIMDEGFRMLFPFGLRKRSKAGGGNTPAYSPPESFTNPRKASQPSLDCWALGVIIFIMLTGLHPFDLDGNATDEEIEQKIRSYTSPSLRKSPVTAHLSESAVDLIEKLMERNPRRRLTAMQMLEHPWVRGETARTDKMADSDKKLFSFRAFKSKLQAKVFEDWCTLNDPSKGASLIERSFRAFDTERKGFLTTRDLMTLDGGAEIPKNRSVRRKDGADDASLSLSGFSDLLAENMKSKFFPRGHTVYKQGEAGNHMYFINAGIVEITTKDGIKSRRSNGDFFGEGALLSTSKERSATITCVTPVHAIEISREYFDKYVASGSSTLSLNLHEKDRTRKRNRALTILRLQRNLRQVNFSKGDHIFKEGERGETLYILEEGVVNVEVRGKPVFTVKRPGDILGEHALIMNRPRNVSAICVADKCAMLEMNGRDFYSLSNASPRVRNSLRELCFRRNFQKALVLATGKPFPSVAEADLREAFNAADTDKSGHLTLDEMKDLLSYLDESFTDEEIRDVVDSLDLNDSGKVSFEEFKQIFGMDENRAASM